MTTKGPLFEILRDVIRDNVDASRKETCEAFIVKLRSEKEAFKWLAEAYFYLNVGKFDINQLGRGHSVTVTPKPPESRIQTIEKSRKRTEEVYRKMKSRLANVILMDLVMPNGKRLRECKLAECSKFGGFFSELARHGKPTQVVDLVFKEHELKSIRDRYLSNQPLPESVTPLRGRRPSPPEMRV